MSPSAAAPRRMRGFGHANRCVTDLGAEKLCCTCHEWWPADAEFFARNRARPDGLSSQCKACVAAHDRGARGPAAPAPLPVPAVFNISLKVPTHDQANPT